MSHQASITAEALTAGWQMDGWQARGVTYVRYVTQVDDKVLRVTVLWDGEQFLSASREVVAADTREPILHGDTTRTSVVRQWVKWKVA